MKSVNFTEASTDLGLTKLAKFSVREANSSAAAAAFDFIDDAHTAPDAPTDPTKGASGNVETGEHSWKMTWVTAGGESAPSDASDALDVTTAASKVTITIAVSARSNVTDRNIYRTVSGDTGDYKLVGAVGDNTATIFEDDVADGSLGDAAPSADSTGNRMYEVELAANSSTSEVFGDDSLSSLASAAEDATIQIASVTGEYDGTAHGW